MESRVPREEYVKMKATDRLRTWKWWFILLLLLGLIAAAWAFRSEFLAAPHDLGQNLGAAAYTLAYMQGGGSAGEPTTGVLGKKQDDEMRPFIMIGILALIAVITLVCLGVSLFSTNAGAVSTASDLLKTCIGFFIGIVTGYFG